VLLHARPVRMRILSRAALAITLVLVPSASAAQEEEPKKWEELFFPFPIVGAPPQLEQQVQVFNSYFHGTAGHGDVPSAELGVILAPHLGLVATVPFQVGGNGQTTGLQDASLLAQWLAAGSLEYDDMLSLGVMGTFPVGRDDLSSHDYYVGPFAYGAQRFFHRLIVEGNATMLLPVLHDVSTRQLLGTGLVSVLVTPRHYAFPIYTQVELDSTTYVDGSAALPPGSRSSPAETLFLAPELFFGPFDSKISDGTRIALGVAVNLVGDSVHGQTYTITAAFDIPNAYGY